MNSPVIHIISHTDLDGVTAAAVARKYAILTGRVPKISLSTYGEVDVLAADAINRGTDFIVLDLFTERESVVALIDEKFNGDEPLIFDHHASNLKYANRKWALLDTSCCAAMLYWKWLMKKDFPGKDEIAAMEDIVVTANDRDLWLGKIPDGRLWQALITQCGKWSVLTRLAENSSAELTDAERECAELFVAAQEKRFAAAKTVMSKTRELAFVPDGFLDFGDASDFCGQVLDIDPNPPFVAAVCSKKINGGWAVSLRSRDGFAGRIVALLNDGKKVRGGGHNDASALYFPSGWDQNAIRNAILSAIETERSNKEQVNVTLGSLFGNIKL